MPPSCAAVINARLASKLELETVYGLEDLYDLLEVLAVDAHNQRAAMKQ